MKKDAKGEAPILMNESGNNGETPGPEAKRISASLILELVFSVILLSAICALRSVQTYANTGTPDGSAGTIWIYMGASTAVFAVLRIFWRKPYFACIFMALATFLAVNFEWLTDFVRLFIQTDPYTAIAGIALYLGLLAGFFFLLRLLYKKNSLPMHIIVRTLAAALACLVLFDAVLGFTAAGRNTPNDTQAAMTTPAATAPAPSATPAPTTDAVLPEATPAPTPKPFGRPNIYYFILDEYSSFDMLKKYYKYDNKVLDDFLSAKGFNIVRESYSTDTQTEHVICDFLNLKYISRHYSKGKCFKAISKASIYKVFKDLGYSQFQYSTSEDHFKGIPSLDSEKGQQAYQSILMGGGGPGKTASDDAIPGAISELLRSEAASSKTKVDASALNQWGFYPSDYIRNTKKYKRDGRREHADAMLSIFDYFEDPAHYAATQPRVIYSYMSATHVPFTFNEYGGILSGGNRNWRDTKVYLGQYKFISKHLMATVSTITKYDPDSIIIIMSDHGIRYHADCAEKHKFYITDKDSCRIMNAVYIKGQAYNIEGLSGVNTLRYILSLYDGLNYPPIKDPVTSKSPSRLRGIIPRTR